MNPQDLTRANPKRKRFRFKQVSLRGALVLMTLVAVGLGLRTIVLNPVRAQWNAVRPLLARGAQVETSPSNLPNWLKGFLTEGETENIESLSFRSAGGIKPGDLDCLEQLPHLKRLYLERCGVKDKDVEQICQHKPLERLAIWGNHITNASASPLVEHENLKVVDVKKTSMDWRAIQVFEKRPNLDVRFDYRDSLLLDDSEIDQVPIRVTTKIKYVTVTNATELTPQKALQKFPNLYFLSFEGPLQLTEESITAFAERERGKKTLLNFKDYLDVDDSFWDLLSKNFRVEFVRYYAGWKGSVYLRHKSNSSFCIRLNQLTKDIVARPSATALFATGKEFTTEGVGVEAIEFAKQFKGLKKMSFTNCTFTSFKGWSGCENLHSLSLGNCRDLRTINSLGEFESLRDLSLYYLPELSSFDGFFEKENKPAKLTRVAIRSLPKVTDFRAVVNTDVLRRIDISECVGLTELSWLAGSLALEKFTISNCKNLNEINGLTELPALKTICISSSYSNGPHITRVSNCDFAAPKTEFSLFSSANFADFTAFESVTGITELNITSSDKLESCQGIHQLDLIRALVLIHGDNLKSIDGLQNLPNLKSLDVRECGLKDKDVKPTIIKLAKSLEKLLAPESLKVVFEKAKKRANNK